MTNEDLNKCPLNCGNCEQMKIRIIERKDERRVAARCRKGRIFNTPSEGWLVDVGRGAKTIPLAWKAALQCRDFRSMIGDDL